MGGDCHGRAGEERSRADEQSQRQSIRTDGRGARAPCPSSIIRYAFRCWARETACLAGRLSCGFPGRPARPKPVEDTNRRREDRLNRYGSASGYQPFDNIECKIGPKVPHDPCPSSQGHPPGSSGQKKEMEKPRPSPAGPRKSLYAVISARETSLVHPLKVDSRMRERHMAVRWKPRITILPKRKRAARSGVALQPTGGHPLQISRPDSFRLCASSQSGAKLPS